MRWTEGVEPKTQKIFEAGFQIRTMKEEAPKAGCVHAGRISLRLDSSSSNVQSGLCPRMLVLQEWMGSFSVMHLPAPWEADSFLEHGDYLASCLELGETPAACTPKHHIYLILGLIFLFYIAVGTH